MQTCFLKRFLPFALTLMVGLMVGKFMAPANFRSNRVAALQQSGYGWGSGEGWGGSARGLPDENRQFVPYDSRTFAPRDVDQKARIISRIEPQYTEEARQHMAAGTVVLRAVFSASGEVTYIRVVSALPYGLTEEAVGAARGIKFSPAMKDGRPVSQYIQLEYNFSLY
jgi:TonB family protein